jgi:hypothetical protein
VKHLGEATGNVSVLDEGGASKESAVGEKKRDVVVGAD